MPYRIVATPTNSQTYQDSRPRYISKSKDFEETWDPKQARQWKTRRGVDQALRRKYTWPNYKFEIEVIDESLNEI